VHRVNQVQDPRAYAVRARGEGCGHLRHASQGRLHGNHDIQDLHPAPDSGICCGLSILLSVMESTALKEPTAAGLNVTVISQEAAAATLVSQPLDCENLVGLVP